MYRKHVQTTDQSNSESQLLDTKPITGMKTLDKISQIPVVTSALNNVTDYYGQIKGKNTLLRTSCNLAEMSLKTMYFASTPITAICRNSIETVDTYLSEKVDFIENKYPLINQPTDQITSAAYSQAKDIYEKPKETLYKTVSTAAACSGKVLEQCLDSRYGKMVCDPVLDFTEKSLNHYLPTPSIYDEPEQGTVKRIFNINKRVYSHVYEVLQLSKLHAHFERTIEKLYSLVRITNELYVNNKDRVVETVSQNSLVQMASAYLKKNDMSLAKMEEITKSYYKAILADVTDIIERYMGLIKKFPAYLNATQFRTTIENLKSQMNKETFAIYLSMSIDYLKQMNVALISYTNKMVQVAVSSKSSLSTMCMESLKSNMSKTQIQQETQTLDKEVTETLENSNDPNSSIISDKHTQTPDTSLEHESD